MSCIICVAHFTTSYYLFISFMSFICYTKSILITAPAGTVARYCDEHVCVSLCLEHISGAICAIYQIFCACCLWPTAVARSSSSRVTKSQGEGAILAVFLQSSPLTMHCSAFAAKGIIQLPINVMQQKGSFSVPGKRK